MNEKILTQELVEMSALIEDDGLGGAFREFNINDLVRYIQVQRDIDLVETLDRVRKQFDDHSRQEVIDWIDALISQQTHYNLKAKCEYNGYLKSNG